jgi:hypothetical protein
MGYAPSLQFHRFIYNDGLRGELWMTMHLVGPYMSTNKSRVRGKKLANTAAKREADAKHEKWLKERGLHPSQRDLQQAFKGKAKISAPSLKVEENYPLSNQIEANGFARGVMANLHKETPEVQKKIMEKASRVAPLYNKGGLQYITDGTDLTEIGSKSRRG